MNIPHLIIVEELLPTVRRNVARSLVREGWSQSRIASVLGISQAMVSKYLKEAGGCPRTLEPMCDIISRELTASLLAEAGLSEISERFCFLSRTLMAEGMMSFRFRERFGCEPSAECFDPQSGPGPRSRVLVDLSEALTLIVNRDISPLIPAVKVNMVQAVDGAVSRAEVGSFPGRLMDRGGRITGALPPEFASSKHLARILLLAMRDRSDVRSAINLRLGDDVIGILGGRKGFHLVDRESGSLEEFLAGDPSTELRYVADPGDFGVEPCLYIFGRSAKDVVIETMELARSLNMKKGDARNER